MITEIRGKYYYYPPERAGERIMDGGPIGTVVCPYCLREIAHSPLREGRPTWIYKHNSEKGKVCEGSRREIPLYLEEEESDE
jgi:hypothetical protein